MFSTASQITSRFLEKIANITHIRSNLRTCIVPKYPLGPFLRLCVAVRVDLEDYFGQKWSQTMSGLHKNRNCMLVDLSGTDSVLGILADSF